MVELFGTTINTPSIDISGFLSSSWIYVLIVAVIGFMVIAGIAVLLFFMTYNRKIILFENVSGLGYQPVLKTRARIIKIGLSGVEVLKTLKGGEVISAYGRKMGTNSYWYAKGQDGYWYNFVLGDLDVKLAMLDIDPIDRDVRMFHAAKNKLTDAQYGHQPNFLEKYGPSMILLFAVVILMVGAYIISGKISEGLSASPEVAKVNKETAELLNQMASRLDSIQRGANEPTGQGGSGLVPATNITIG